MNTKELFITKCTEIENEILAIKTDNPNILPISDGIVNIDNYLSAQYKILWILKESNDLDENNEGGGWSLTKAINGLNSWEDQPQRGRTTFQRIIYSTYGLLNDFILWEDMPYISNEEVFESIKKIAYVNIKKLPGYATSKPKEIDQAYEVNKILLKRQIDLYNPDIIIAGNTLEYFFEDLSIPFDNKKSNGKTAYYPTKERLYIHPYHPNVRPVTINEENYCNDIILAGKDWVENKNNYL